MRAVIVLLVAALCLCLSAAVRADVIPANADSTIEAEGWAFPISDHGNKGTETIVRTGGPDNARDLYLHFDLSSLNPANTVTSATLLMKNVGASGSLQNFYAIMDKSLDWNLVALPESGAGSISWLTAPRIDLSNMPAATNGRFLNEGGAVGSEVRLLGQVPGTDIALNVTDLIRWQLGQNVAYSNYLPTDDELTICARKNDINDYEYVDWLSREGGAPTGDVPRLEIMQEAPQPQTGVPEPGSLALLVMGGLATLRRRR